MLRFTRLVTRVLKNLHLLKGKNHSFSDLKEGKISAFKNELSVLKVQVQSVQRRQRTSFCTS